MKGHQRYKCKNCGYQYTKTTPHGKPEKDKILALILFLSGLSMRATGKIVGVTTQSVMRWIRQMHNKFITEKPDIATVTEVEMDEDQNHTMSGKLLIIKAKNSSGGHWDVVIPKH